MTLKKSFQNLAEKLECLRLTTEELLQWAVTQGKPVAMIERTSIEEDHALVGKYYEDTIGLTSLTEEAIAAADEGQQAVAEQIDLARARRVLITCQDRVNQLTQVFFSKMVSFEALDDLESLAREQSKWEQWVFGVKDALRRCREPIAEVNQALFELWQELTEHAGVSSVSVQAISSGNQFKLMRKSMGSCRADQQ
jgi:hypothetical protein